MTRLEAVLRLSILQGELRQLAEVLDEDEAKVTNYAANVLNLLRAQDATKPDGQPVMMIVGGASSRPSSPRGGPR